MYKDNRTIEEIQKNILLLQEQTEAIKKKGEEELKAIKKKGEEELNALKKDGEARHQKHLAEMEAIKKKGEEELNAVRKETETVRKETEAVRKETEAVRKEIETVKLVEKDVSNKLRITLKDLGKQMYNMGINIGFGVEESIYNALDLYKRLDGIDYDKIYKNNVYKDFKTDLTKGESDIILVNGHHAAIVEVKHRLTINHIRDFYTKKMPLFMEYEQKFEGKKVHIYFACESFENDVIKEATNKGCGLIEPRYNDIASIVKAS